MISVNTHCVVMFMNQPIPVNVLSSLWKTHDCEHLMLHSTSCLWSISHVYEPPHCLGTPWGCLWIHLNNPTVNHLILYLWTFYVCVPPGVSVAMFWSCFCFVFCSVLWLNTVFVKFLPVSGRSSVLGSVGNLPRTRQATVNMLRRCRLYQKMQVFKHGYIQPILFLFIWFQTYWLAVLL